MGYFQYDFIVKNNKYEHNPVVLADDDQTSFWEYSPSGEGNVALEIEDTTVIVKSGDNALSINFVEGAYATLYLIHTFSVAQDWSSYDFFTFWLYGQDIGQTLRLWIWTPDGGNKGYYDYIFETVGWNKIILPLRNFIVTGNYDLTNVQKLWLTFKEDWGWNAGKFLVYDNFSLDVGRWVDLELYVPDNLASYPEAYMELWSWSGSEWVKFCEWHGDGVYLSNDIYTTDGWSLKSVFDFLPVEVYPQDEYGETVEGIRGLRSITYSQKYGTRYRVGFSLYMPPRKSIKLRLRCNFNVTEVASLNV